MTQETRFINRRLNSTPRLEKPPFVQATQLAYALAGIGFIGGGMARAMIAGDAAPEASDIDVFCLRADSFGEVQRAVTALGYRYIGEQGSAGAYEGRYGQLTVQIVPTEGVHNTQRRYGQPADVIADFTFVTEQFAVYAVDGDQPLRAVYTRDALTDTKIKRLRLNRIASPLYATWRISKYSRKGYRISLTEVQRLFAAWEGMERPRRDEMLSAGGAPGDLYREIGNL